ncbi:MAG: cytochrome c peroxidase, partial [Planctomycetota bacterium]
MKSKTDLWPLAALLLTAACGGERVARLAGAESYLAPEPAAPATDPRFVDEAAALELGQVLFHEPRLNLDQRTSCAGCHIPWKGFAGPPLKRTDGTRRDVPSLIGAAGRERLGWTGELGDFAAAVAHPFGDVDGFGSSNIGLLRAFNDDQTLQASYRAAFGVPPATDDEPRLVADVQAALGRYVAELADLEGPFDRGVADPSGAPLAADARRGWEVFRSKGCARCHSGPNFTDDELRWHGLMPLDRDPEPELEDDPLLALEGEREAKRPAPVRTPSLRNVTRTAPYMHDGRFATLDRVLDFYERGVEETREETGMASVVFSARERADLLALFTALETDVLPAARTGATVPPTAVAK